MKINYIPLYSQLFERCGRQLYYWCGLVSLAVEYNKDMELSWTPIKSHLIMSYLNVSRNIYYTNTKDLFTMPLNELDHNDYVEMPLKCWQRLHTDLTRNAGEFSTNERCSITRVYCYLYYRATIFGGEVAVSRIKLASALKIEPRRLSTILIWLELHKMIYRSVYVKPKNGEPGLTRTYSIPEDDLTERCRKLREMREKSQK